MGDEGEQMAAATPFRVEHRRLDTVDSHRDGIRWRFSRQGREEHHRAHEEDERLRRNRDAMIKRRDLALQRLRVVIQELQALFERVQAGQGELRTVECSTETAAHEVDGILDHLVPDTPYADTILDGEAMPGIEVLYRIRTLWRQMRDYAPLRFPYCHTPDAKQQTNELTQLLTACRSIVFEIGTLTIPARVNDWLAGARSGYYVPFHQVFDDEVPVREDREKILNYLSWSPRAVRNGLVDTNTGFIYRYDQSAWGQIAALLWIVAGFALCTALVLVAAQLGNEGGFDLTSSVRVFRLAIPPIHLPHVEDWPIAAGHEGKLAVGWLTLLAGVVLHLAIAFAKRQQTGMPPVFSMDEALPRVSAFWTQIVLKLALGLFAFFALQLALGGGSYLNLFLAGYTLDSVVELFGATLEQRANAQAAGLKQQLGMAKGI
jgi:hypothetical protein